VVDDIDSMVDHIKSLELSMLSKDGVFDDIKKIYSNKYK